MSVETAVEHLRRNELVVLPTDTVYGVAALINENALLCLYEAKQRDLGKAIPVLLSDPKYIYQVAAEISEPERLLMQTFWPGALTLVVSKRPDVPALLSQTDTVGVRIPDHALTRAIIEQAGGALAVTSANLSGHPAACTVEEARLQLGESVSFYVDGGRCAGGQASTVARVHGSRIEILRAGPITEAQLYTVGFGKT